MVPFSIFPSTQWLAKTIVHFICDLPVSLDCLQEEGKLVTETSAKMHTAYIFVKTNSLSLLGQLSIFPHIFLFFKEKILSLSIIAFLATGFITLTEMTTTTFYFFPYFLRKNIPIWHFTNTLVVTLHPLHLTDRAEPS